MSVMAARPWLLYAGRRWRTTGIVIVAVLGTLVYGAVADRGHDPLWSADGDDLEAIALAEDGNVLFAVRKAGEGRTLEARDAFGALLWNRTFPGEVLLDTGRGWVAVAEPSTPSRLAILRAVDGVTLLAANVGGSPRGIAADGETVALSLQSPDNAVLVWTRLAQDRSVHLPTFVTALDVSGETVAAGAADGTVAVDRSGVEVARFASGISVRSVRLDASTGRLAVGGFGSGEGDLTGGVAVYDLDAQNRSAAPIWASETVSGVGFVDMARDGSVVLALEETPVRSSLRITPGEGGPALRHAAQGVVPRIGSAGSAAVRLAPDGSGFLVGTLTGDVQYVDLPSGDVRWTWRSKGTLAVDVAQEAPGTFVASARLVASQGYDRVVLFDAAREPFLREAAVLVPVAIVLELALGALVLGVGRFRELRA